MPTAKKPESYYVRSGKKTVLLGVTPEEHDLLSRAAAADERPVTQFVVRAAISAARKILRNSPKV